MRRYFTLFGILAATIMRKMNSLFSSIDSMLDVQPKIIARLLASQLKPIKHIQQIIYKQS